MKRTDEHFQELLQERIVKQRTAQGGQSPQ